MNEQVRCRWRFGLVACIIAGASLMGAWSRCPAQQQVENDLPEIREAERLVKEIAQLGPKLNTLLADQKQPIQQRFRAGNLMAKLRYEPGIPTLIRHLELIDPQEVVPDPTFHCVEALTLYGDVAVPSLVDAFLEFKGRGQIRENSMYMAIAMKSQSVARTYAKGRAAQNPDPKFQQRVEYFLNKIKPDVPR